MELLGTVSKLIGAFYQESKLSIKKMDKHENDGTEIPTREFRIVSKFGRKHWIEA